MVTDQAQAVVPIDLLDLLICPITSEPLSWNGVGLVSKSGRNRYVLSKSGIPQFTAESCSTDAIRQQLHYDRVTANYIENLGYPHTQEYLEYLDGALMRLVGDGALGNVAELCCGRGEAFRLFANRFRRGIGVDVSLAMLEKARQELPQSHLLFVQADATRLPLQAGRFDHVFILGGIHHINDREGLFREAYRILKPAGRLVFREPVSDFFLWRWLRAVIYRVSPALDHETERPLRYAETVPLLEGIGFTVRAWRTYGFLGGAILLNSDVLVITRLLRFLPGIRPISRALAMLDDRTVRLPGFANAGLQVIGMAEKSGEAGHAAERRNRRP